MALHCKKNLCKLNVFKCCWGLYPNDSAVKNPPTSAGDVRNVGSISGWEDPLEEEMATHSSVLPWRIPWTEEPGGL